MIEYRTDVRLSADKRPSRGASVTSGYSPSGHSTYGGAFLCPSSECTVPDMPIWKLKPINPDDEHWNASAYTGPLFVRAADDDGARELAASEYHRGAEKPSVAKVLKTSWPYAWLTTCTRVEDSEYDEDGPDAILGPEEALSRVHPPLL